MFQVEVAIFQMAKPTKKRCIYSVVRIKSGIWKGVKKSGSMGDGTPELGDSNFESNAKGASTVAVVVLNVSKVELPHDVHPLAMGEEGS